MCPTHGSLTKAGKVRLQTPKMEGKKRASRIPKCRVRRNYVKRIIQNKEPGQQKMDARGRGGRRR